MEKKLSPIPICHFPTTVVLIDDNRSFLENIRLELDTAQAAYKLFDNAIAALAYLSSEATIDPITNRFLSTPEDSDRDQHSLHINLGAIHKEIYTVQRFAQVSVVVIDYAMPGINGADLAEKLKDKPYKIILLTGEANETRAVKLFNDHIIHYYVRKADSRAMENLRTSIARLQQEYFQKLSRIVLHGVIANSDPLPLACLTDPIFIKFFNELVREHNVVEYYLLDESGSFLFLDEVGKPSWFLVKHEGEMQSTEYDINFPDIKINSETRQKINTRQLLRHFFTDQDAPQTDTEWQTVLYSATKLSGRKDYYYSYVTEPSGASDIDIKRIISFETYLQKYSVI
jgi:CheY-like chemotaxis protein